MGWLHLSLSALSSKAMSYSLGRSGGISLAPKRKGGGREG